MTPRSDWIMTLYGANAQPVSPVMPYASIAVSSLTSLTGYDSKQVYIVAPSQAWALDTFEFIGSGGVTYARSRRRSTFNVELWPFTWATSDQDYDDLDALASIIDTKAFLWARIEGGSARTYPATAAHAIPVDVVTLDTALSKGSAWKAVTLGLRQRGRT